MISQICSIKPEDVARLLAKLELEDLNLILRERRFPLFGHVECSSGAVRTACDIQIEGRRGAARLKLTWKKLTEKDCHENPFPYVEARNSSPSRKEHLEIRCEICHVCV